MKMLKFISCIGLWLWWQSLTAWSIGKPFFCPYLSQPGIFSMHSQFFELFWSVFLLSCETWNNLLSEGGLDWTGEEVIMFRRKHDSHDVQENVAVQKEAKVTRTNCIQSFWLECMKFWLHYRNLKKNLLSVLQGFLILSENWEFEICQWWLSVEIWLSLLVEYDTMRWNGWVRKKEVN